MVEDRNATMLGITLNLLYASVGVVSTIIYGKQAYEGVKVRVKNEPKPPPSFIDAPANK